MIIFSDQCQSMLLKHTYGSTTPVTILTDKPSSLHGSMRIVYTMHKKKLTNVSLSITNSDDVAVGEFSSDGRFIRSFSHYSIFNIRPNYNDKLEHTPLGAVHSLSIRRCNGGYGMELYNTDGLSIYYNNIDKLQFNNGGSDLRILLTLAKEYGKLDLQI